MNMLTIFAIPKPFTNPHIAITQKNAIASWKKAVPNAQIILFGNDAGVAESAKEFSVTHVPDIDKTETGTPLLSSAINMAQAMARHEVLLYTNADIIFTSDLMAVIAKVKQPLFLMSGQRWDTDVKEKIDVDNPDWEKTIKEKAYRTGKLHGPRGMDYCIFPRKFPDVIHMPAFTVGRPGWDNWLIWRAHMLGMPVIDATGAITAVHQNHDYSHSTFGQKGRVAGPDYKRNIALAWGFMNMMTLREANFILTERGLEQKIFPQSLFSLLAMLYPWRLLLGIYRHVR